MKHIIKLSFAFLISLTAQANFIENGDFQKGRRAWTGEIKIKQDAAHSKDRVCRLNPSSTEHCYINQEITLDQGVEALSFSFRARMSPDYDGEPLLIRFVRPNRETTDFERVVDSAEWTDFELTYDRVKSDEITLAIFARKTRSGYIEIDDLNLVKK